MIFLPRTTPRIYVSSILALNINSPEHTGDWHSSMYWDHLENSKIDLWIFGDGLNFNTNHLQNIMKFVGTQFHDNVDVYNFFQEY